MDKLEQIQALKEVISGITESVDVSKFDVEPQFKVGSELVKNGGHYRYVKMNGPNVHGFISGWMG